MPDTPGARAVLGDKLRGYRKAARLSGETLARGLSMSQSRISRIEAGQTRISTADVARWLDIVEAPEHVRREVALLSDHADSEVVSWSDLHALGWTRHQKRYDELEHAATCIKAYLISCIPGLLQTADLNAFLMRHVVGASEEQVGTAVTAKLARQKVLYDPATRYEVVVSEAVLRQRIGGPAIMVEQLHHIATVAALPTVDFGFIPIDTDLSVPYFTSFDLFELPEEGHSVVMIELETGEVPDMSPGGIARYAKRFEEYKAASIRGQDAIDGVMAIARGMTEQMFQTPAHRLR